MIYRSNLRCPDLTPHFPHLDVRVMPHSHGHSVPSDWADKAVDDPVFGLYKNCGLLTHDEASILWNIAERMPGTWLDIGSHTGWSTAHILTAMNGTAVGIDPMYGVAEFYERTASNMRALRAGRHNGIYFGNYTSRTYFEVTDRTFSGAMIDGDHSVGQPLLDAQNSLKHLEDDGVIVFHDFIGKPVRDAVSYLIDQGLNYHIYWTPHVMACCWRGNFTPPEHYADPLLIAHGLDREMSDFDFNRQGVSA